MIAEFLTRLAVALPLVTGLAVLVLVAVKKGWIVLPGLRFPGFPRSPLTWRFAARRGVAESQGLRVLGVHAIAPAARVAVIRFHGREHLLAVNGQSLLLIASEEMTVCNDGDGGRP